MTEGYVSVHCERDTPVHIALDTPRFAVRQVEDSDLATIYDEKNPLGWVRGPTVNIEDNR